MKFILVELVSDILGVYSGSFLSFCLLQSGMVEILHRSEHQKYFSYWEVSVCSRVM